MRLDQLFGKRSARRLGSKQTWPPHQLGGLRRPGTRLADESLFLAARLPGRLTNSPAYTNVAPGTRCSLLQRVNRRAV